MSEEPLRPQWRAVMAGMAAFGALALVSVWQCDDARGQNAGRGDGARAEQRAILFEEDASTPNGLRFAGSTVWSSDAELAGSDAEPQIVIRAKIVVPKRAMTLTWELRRNRDKLLPASHRMDFIFVLPPNPPHGDVENVPGLLAKPAETARGAPLRGIAIKVTRDHFLFGLSTAAADSQANTTLLKEQSWFDVPIVFSDGRRAILAFEKGLPGARMVHAAFAAWETEDAPPASPDAK